MSQEKVFIKNQVYPLHASWTNLSVSPQLGLRPCPPPPTAVATTVIAPKKLF